MKLLDAIVDISKRHPERKWYGLTDGVEFFTFHHIFEDELDELHQETDDATANNLWWEELEL